MDNDIPAPVIDTCDFGHRFAKLPGHPVNSSQLPQCPYCMSIGLKRARQTIQDQLDAVLLLIGQEDELVIRRVWDKVILAGLGDPVTLAEVEYYRKNSQ
jgi:hypothetical protein